MRAFFQRMCGLFVAGFLIWLLAGCGQAPPDFRSMDKTDVHVHLNTDKTDFVDAAAACGFRLLTINVDVAEYPPLPVQREWAAGFRKRFPDRVAFATAFAMKGFGEADWLEKSLSYLDESFALGAAAVKVWKNIGMVEKDSDGRFIMVDDPRLKPIFDSLERKSVPVVAHLAEPRNCWLPLEQMTVRNDRNYFQRHPEYHMFLHPEYPSQEAILTARDNMLEAHPGLTFIGCHLGSLEWDVDTLASWLDRFPKAAVDMAARVPPLQHQSVQERDKVRNFFIRYQDRLLYATDQSADGTDDPARMKERLEKKWRTDWAYLATDTLMTAPEVEGPFMGLKLPRSVLEKVYSKNARKWYRIFQ